MIAQVNFPLRMRGENVQSSCGRVIVRTNLKNKLDVPNWKGKLCNITQLAQAQ